MHQQDEIDRAVGQRHIAFVDQRRQRRACRRPLHNPLRARHEGEASFGLVAKQPQIGRRIANSEHTPRARIGPAAADAAANEAARDHPQPVGVEITQVNDIHGHALY